MVAAFGLAAATASAGSDIYKPETYLARYCTPTRDICVGIFNSGGIVFQLMTVKKYFDRYTLCVRSPRGRNTCRGLPVNRQGRVWGSHKRWRRHFGDCRPGVYRVTWSHARDSLGPSLRFSHR